MTIHPWARDKDTFQGQTKILLAEKKGGVGKVQATNSACTKWPPWTVTFRGSMLSGIQRPLQAKWLRKGKALALAHPWCLLLAPRRSSAKCVGTWWHHDLWRCYHHWLLPAYATSWGFHISEAITVRNKGKGSHFIGYLPDARNIFYTVEHLILTITAS